MILKVFDTIYLENFMKIIYDTVYTVFSIYFHNFFKIIKF